MSILTRLKERKLVHWALAYIAGGWVALQVVDVVAEPWGLTDVLLRSIQVVIVAGVFVTLVLAWYHGEKGRQRVSGPELGMLTALFVITGGVLTLVGRSEEPAPEGGGVAGLDRADDERPAIAVLPLDNLSPDPENEYFADGLHDELLVQLDRIDSLKVISRTSVLGYRDTPRSARIIASELDVSHILEGSVRKTADRLRVSVQLIDALSDDHLWSATIDTTYSVESVFGVQAELARRIAGSLSLRLDPLSRELIASAPTPVPEAFEAYLAARVHRQRILVEGEARAAQRLYERAVALDPGYAAAWRGLAEVRGLLAWNYGQLDQIPEARAAVERLERLGTDLEDTHLARGYVAYYANGDFQAALDAFEMVRQRSGLDGELAFILAAMLRRMRRWEAAVSMGRAATRLDPRNASSHAVLGRAFFRMRRFDEAERALRTAIELTPDVPVYFRDLVQLELWGRGDTAAAAEVVREARARTTVEHTRFRVVEADLAWVRGASDEALEAFTSAGNPLTVALLHRRRGRLDEARDLADSIRHETSERLEKLVRYSVEPAIQRSRVHRALAFALLDRRDESVRELEEAVGSDPIGHDAYSSPGLDAALTYTELGMHSRAVSVLQVLLEHPFPMTVPRLRLDPRWDPLRDHPGFQALLERS